MDGMDQSSVSQQFEQLVKKGESMPRCDDCLDFPRVQGEGPRGDL